MQIASASLAGVALLFTMFTAALAHPFCHGRRIAPYHPPESLPDLSPAYFSSLYSMTLAPLAITSGLPELVAPGAGAYTYEDHLPEGVIIGAGQPLYCGARARSQGRLQPRA